MEALNLRNGDSTMVLVLRGVIWKGTDEPVVKDQEAT
jgi:hypothetical protein